MATTHVLYLHGFRSSPQSSKAQMFAERIARDFPKVLYHCPQLPISPKEAMEGLMRDIADWPEDRMAVLGSSLGGYYATWFAEQTGCKCVCLNPAIYAARDLATQVGEIFSWHDPSQKYFFTTQHVEELKPYAVPAITKPERYYALIAKGDEVLDWREMSAHYPDTKGKLIEGSDHGIAEFADYFDEVLAFLDLAR